MGKDAMNSLILTYCSISSSDKKRRSSFPLVILSEAKDLALGNKILRFAQNDKVIPRMTSGYSPF